MALSLWTTLTPLTKSVELDSKSLSQPSNTPKTVDVLAFGKYILFILPGKVSFWKIFGQRVAEYLT